jgi:hypothetical protein
MKMEKRFSVAGWLAKWVFYILRTTVNKIFSRELEVIV